MLHRISLNDLAIAAPCDQDWGSMVGDERVRFCGGCKKHVYNFAALSMEEGLKLIADTEGELCGRISRRQDGTVITGNCPIGVQAQLKRCYRGLAYGSAAGIFILASMWGLERSRSRASSAELHERSETLVEKVEEWMDSVRVWAGFPSRRPKAVMMGGCCAPPSPPISGPPAGQ